MRSMILAENLGKEDQITCTVILKARLYSQRRILVKLVRRRQRALRHDTSLVDLNIIVLFYLMYEVPLCHRSHLAMSFTRVCGNCPFPSHPKKGIWTWNLLTQLGAPRHLQLISQCQRRTIRIIGTALLEEIACSSRSVEDKDRLSKEREVYNIT